MPTTSTRFTHEKAPCGRFVDGERFLDQDQDQDQDQEGQSLVTDEVVYACGCKSFRQEYHDGTVAEKVIRHDGHILVDELDSGS
jgi:hypothetical protein